MYYEFYIDVFFAENMVLDCLLLLLAGTALKFRLKPFRLLLAGAIGAWGACIPVFFPFLRIWPARFLLAAALGICMMKTAFGISQKRLMAEGILLFWGTSHLMAGFFEILALDLTLPVILSGVLCAVILKLLLEYLKTRKTKTQMMYEVTLVLGDKSVVLKALKDTGNQLREPIKGRPVSVGDQGPLESLLTPATPVFLIPFYSIGNSGGVLPGFTIDFMLICGDGVTLRIDHPVVAVSKEPVSRKGEYQLILSPFLTA